MKTILIAMAVIAVIGVRKFDENKISELTSENNSAVAGLTQQVGTLTKDLKIARDEIQKLNPIAADRDKALSAISEMKTTNENLVKQVKDLEGEKVTLQSQVDQVTAQARTASEINAANEAVMAQNQAAVIATPAPRTITEEESRMVADLRAQEQVYREKIKTAGKVGGMNSKGEIKFDQDKVDQLEAQAQAILQQYASN